MSASADSPKIKHSMRHHFWLKLAIMLAVLAVAFFGSFWIGSCPIAPVDVINILASKFADIEVYWPATEDTIVWKIRFPRIMAAILIGGALATSGASYQTLFKNPMVSPDLLGVSAGASFGACLAMINDGTWWEIQIGALVFGLVAVAAAFIIGSTMGRNNITVLVLAGVVISSLFSALVSILKTLADTESQLPEITFWLMGSLSKADNNDVLLMLPAIGLSLLLLFLFRHQIDALAAGEEEARTLGINTMAVKIVIVVCSTLMTVCSVAVAGVVGWVGLVIPHIARGIVGAGYGRLAAASFVLGGLFLLVIDNIIRGAFGVDLPLGVMTALVGTPVFIVLLSRAKKAWM